MDVEKDIIEYQKREKRLQSVVVQRMQMELQKKELENALKELEDYKDEYVYQQVGGVMLKVPVKKAKEDIEERLLLLDRRLKTMQEEEELLKSTLERLAKKLQEQLNKGGGNASS